MRSLLTLGLILATTLFAFSQDSVQSFFEKYQNDESFTQINISPKMFQMISSMDTDDPESADAMELISKLKGLKILTTDVNPIQYYKEFTSSFDQSVYEELMTVKENDKDITFLVKESSSNIVSELLLLVGGTEDFVLMRFEGEIPLDKIGKLANGLNISGAEHLGKLKK